ncbi:hypothetical protein BV511_06580 [Methylorubrum extorquens]|uniref:Uncharacterized protein n=1 Tax=Methylorubrum extorquens TaxID=408 RepID=A0A1S1P028_METEX|nr:hypothetical protein [Methylorubrum extorquens]APX84414.1 hypothetical protein BV511_06580 [Methylorubrum extorquens]OHV14621.1 hypothetical protein BK022_25235 [Methylorubrum extorquens]
MKTLAATVTALLLLSAAPALAMSCCGGSKGKAPMCGKGGMAMNHAGMKGKKGGCCCEGMAGGMSKRG